MSDFLAVFYSPPGPLWGDTGAQDYPAVFAPLVATVDIAAPVGTAITSVSQPLDRQSPVTVQVDDVNSVKYVIAHVKFPDGTWEVAYDGAEWAPRYRTYSSVVVNNGLRQTLTLRREGGWPYSPTISIRAFDGSGNMS